MKRAADGKTSKEVSKHKIVKVQDPLNLEQMLAEDVDNAKRKREALDEDVIHHIISIGYAKRRAINPNFLGPILKKRFLGT